MLRTSSRGIYGLYGTTAVGYEVPWRQVSQVVAIWTACSPVNGAISEISGATAELEGLPIVGPATGAKLQRVMRGVNAAQAKVGAVVSTYSRASRAATQIDERLGVLKEQAAKAGTAINKVAGSISPALANVVPSSSFAAQKTPAVEAVKPFEHLLILQPLSAKAEPYYFNLDTAAFDELSRSSEFRWASQERLTRRPAQQNIGMGDESLTLKGRCSPTSKAGSNSSILCVASQVWACLWR